MTVLPMGGRLAVARSRVAVPRLDWLLLGSAGLIMTIGTLLVWSATASNDVLTGGDSTAYLHRHLVNIMIGLVLAAAVMATDHRWVRIITPLVYVASVIGLMLVLVMGTTINGSRNLPLRGSKRTTLEGGIQLDVVDVAGDDALVSDGAQQRQRHEPEPATAVAPAP